MSFRECIDNAETEGTITPEQASRVRELYEGIYAQNRRTMSDAEAAAAASRETFDSAEFDAIQRKRRLVLQHAAQQRVVQDVLSYEGDFVGDGMSHILDRDGSGRAKFIDLDSRRTSWLARSHANMAAVLRGMRRSSVLGRETRAAKATGRDLVKELFGDDSKNVLAREFADAWRKTSEMLRTAFNKAGGAIPKREDWGMPQQHNSAVIRQAGFDQWRKDIENKLDWNKIISEQDNRRFLEKEREKILFEIYETIVTSGFNKVGESSVAGTGRSLARRRADHRFLVFKSADDWLSYQQLYGKGDPFTIMMDHIDGMARDIAILETLGPNPNSTISFLQTQMKEAAKEADAFNPEARNAAKLQAEQFRLRDIYDDINGSAYVPARENQSRAWASIGELLSAAQLGAAAIMAILGDASTARIAARIAGLPHSKILVNTVKTLVASGATKEELIRAGLVAENWSAVAYGQARYVGDLMGSHVTQRISNATMNLSLLSPITQAERWAYQQNMMGYFSDIAKTRFADLGTKNKRLLERYGIDEADWDAIRSTPKYKHKRASWVRPSDIFERNEAAAQKYLDMLQSETDLAVPVAGPRARSTLKVGRPGTIPGDLFRSIAQYKTFPVVLFQNNLKQFRHLDASNLSRIGYAAEFAVYATMMGGLAMQIKEIAKGRDPLPMFDEDGVPNPKFWGAALLASGSLSLFGDFLFADHNRFGGGIASTIAGPRIGVISDLLGLTIGNVEQVLSGKKTNFAVETIDFLGQYAPGASTFYFRLGLERLILDQLRVAADPGIEQRFRRRERDRMRQYGNDYWWKAGEMQPRRAPDLEAVSKQLPR